MPILASFRKSEACGQTVLPDRILLIGQKLVENAKKDSNETFLRDFQTSFFLQLLVLQYYFNALFFKAYQT